MTNDPQPVASSPLPAVTGGAVEAEILEGSTWRNDLNFHVKVFERGAGRYALYNQDEFFCFLTAGELRERFVPTALANSPAEDAGLQEALIAEQTAIADEARRIAGFYPEASDGQNTFVMLAEWIERRAALLKEKESRGC